MSSSARVETIKVASKSSEVAESLSAMMDRFTAASARLSERHVSLTSEIEQLKERLRMKDEELARAERLSTLGATAAALAHEVRNPLGSIKLFLSLLREDIKGNSTAIKTMDAIERSISHLDSYVSNMLQFAADKPRKLTPISPQIILNEISGHIRAEHPELQLNIDLSGENQAQLTVMCDEAALRQIISNLWRNAGQAMRWKGKVNTSVWSTKDHWGITVRDFGPGIPSKMINTIFEPFVTGRQEGTGLGLAVVKRLVEQHRGTISVYNENPGAVFEIRFLKGIL